MKGYGKVVFLDVDGTIFPYNPHYKAFLKLAKRYDCLAETFNVEALWEEIRYGGNFKEVFFGHFKEILRYNDCPAVERLFREFNELQNKAYSELKPRKGVRKMINVAEELGWKIVFVTNSYVGMVEKQLRDFNLLHNGNLYWPGKNVKVFNLPKKDALKPSGRLFSALTKKYDPLYVVVVGDSILFDGLFGLIDTANIESDKNFVIPSPNERVRSFKRKLYAESKAGEIVFGKKKTQELVDTATILCRGKKIDYPSSFNKVIRWIEKVEND